MKIKLDIPEVDRNEVRILVSQAEAMLVRAEATRKSIVDFTVVIPVRHHGTVTDLNVGVSEFFDPIQVCYMRVDSNTAFNIAYNIEMNILDGIGMVSNEEPVIFCPGQARLARKKANELDDYNTKYANVISSIRANLHTCVLDIIEPALKEVSADKAEEKALQLIVVCYKALLSKFKNPSK